MTDGAVAAFGRSGWPSRGYGAAALATIVVAVGYTVFSERLNVEVRGAWAYRDLMLDLLAAGMGLGTLPDFLSRPAERAGRLVRVLPDHELAPRFVWAVLPSGSRQDARISTFLQALEAARAIPDPA